MLFSLSTITFAQSGLFEQLLSKFFEEAYASQHKELADSVAKSLNEGRIQEAARLLQKSSEGSAQPSANSLAQSLQQASPEDVLRLGALLPDAAGRWRLVPFSESEKVQVRALEEVRVPWRRSTFVTPGAKAFLKDVSHGALDKDAIIDRCLRGITCNPGQQAAVRQFLRAPRSSRIFAIGSGTDTPFANRYSQALEELHQQLFFYQNCALLGALFCDNDLLGALMAESAHIVFLDGPNAAMSDYVFPELKAAKHIQEGQLVMVTISSEELIRAIQSATVTALAVNVYTISEQ